MSTLHDRIEELADEWERQATDVRAGMYGSGMDDAANTLDNAARRLRAVLAETTTEYDGAAHATAVGVEVARALAAAQPVEPEPDEREALGDIWDDGNATGLDGYRGPGRGDFLPVDPEAERARDRVIDRYLANRSRPEATHTVTPERAWDEGHRTGWEHCQDGGYGNDYWDDATPNPYRVTVVDTPTQGGGDA